MVDANEIFHTWSSKDDFIEDVTSSDWPLQFVSVRDSVSKYDSYFDEEGISLGQGMSVIDASGREVEFPLRLVVKTRVVTWEEYSKDAPPPRSIEELQVEYDRMKREGQLPRRVDFG